MTTSRQAALLAEFQSFKLSDLLRRAAVVGASRDELDAAMDSENTRAAFMSLILTKSRIAVEADLLFLKLSELQRRAAAVGASSDELDAAIDSKDPRASFVSLILTKSPVVAKADLLSLKLSELQRRAVAAGSSSNEMDVAIDCEDPRAALVSLILTKSRVAAEAAGHQRPMQPAPPVEPSTKPSPRRFASTSTSVDEVLFPFSASNTATAPGKLVESLREQVAEVRHHEDRLSRRFYLSVLTEYFKQYKELERANVKTIPNFECIHIAGLNALSTAIREQSTTRNRQTNVGNADPKGKSDAIDPCGVLHGRLDYMLRYLELDSKHTLPQHVRESVLRLVDAAVVWKSETRSQEEIAAKVLELDDKMMKITCQN